MANFNNDAMLVAAAQMLQASGPSRQPQGLGAILGGGMATYMGAAEQARQRKMEEDQAKQVAEMRALQMQDLQGTLGDRETARARAERMSGLQQQFAQGRGAPPAPAGMEGQAPAMQGQPAPQAKPKSPYQSAMEYAQFLEGQGEVDQAMSVAQEAQKLRPKVKDFKDVLVNGKVLFAPRFDDGSVGDPVPMEVAEKLMQIDRGGKVDLANAFTGKTEASFGKTATVSDGIAQQRLGLDREKFNFDRTKEAKPQFSAEMGGFIAPPSKANPNGGIIPLAGAPSRGPKMTEDQAKATGWLVQAENAFGNMKAAVKANPGAAKPGFPDAVAGVPSFGISAAVAQTMRSTERQKFLQGASSLSESLLRAATGAGVNKEEAEQKVRELTPVFGDDDATIQQKMEAVPLYIESLKVRAGPGAGLAAGVRQKTAPAAGGWSIKRKD